MDLSSLSQVNLILIRNFLKPLIKVQGTNGEGTNGEGTHGEGTHGDGRKPEL